VTLPFERQTIRNEALPQGSTRLLQAGENGLQEITHRILEEAGGKVSTSPSGDRLEPRPEIVMVGAQASPLRSRSTGPWCTHRAAMRGG
jgi:uncharacterized protein YabE (DUF348 family)